MPKHSDFQKIYDKFVARYGKDKGESYYYAWLKKKGYDDTNPMSKKSEKKEKQCIVRGVEFKESGNEFHVNGLIATSHIDQEDDYIPKETLESFADQINSTDEAGVAGMYHSEAKTGVSYGHAEKTAQVIQLTDGEYALSVDTKYVKSPETIDIINKWQAGELDSFSITYDTEGSTTCDFEWRDGKLVRVIEPDTKVFGYTASSQGRVANLQAKATDYAFKELKELMPSNPQQINEATKMADKKEIKDEDKDDVQDETKNDETKAGDETKSDEGNDNDSAESKEIKEAVKEVKEAFMKELKELLKTTIPKNAPMHNAGDKMEKETKELEIKEKEFKEKLKNFTDRVINNTGSSRSQWLTCLETKEYLRNNRMPIINATESDYIPFEIKELDKPKLCTDYSGAKVDFPSHCFPRIELKENRLEMKDAVTTDTDYSGAQTTYVTALANYEQAPARYNDIYGPYIINQLNDQTTTWNLLAKDDFSNMSSIAFRARTGRNSTAGSYSYGSTPGWDAASQLLKCNLGYVTSYVEIQAEWEAIELGRGAGGIDVYQTEMDNGVLSLMNYLNGQVFGTGDGTSESAALGFEHLVKTNGGGATTIYGRDRAVYTTLDSGGYANLSSAPFTLDQARAMVETVRVNGAMTGDLVFIMSLRQKRLFYRLIQDMQRTVPTSSRVGFTGQPELDGIPLFEDKRLDDDSKTDDVYLIDTRHTRIAMKKAPTYVEMAQVSLHKRGIVWLMWNIYCTAPNHNYWVYGAATS